MELPLLELWISVVLSLLQTSDFPQNDTFFKLLRSYSLITRELRKALEQSQQVLQDTLVPTSTFFLQFLWWKWLIVAEASLGPNQSKSAQNHRLNTPLSSSAFAHATFPPPIARRSIITYTVSVCGVCEGPCSKWSQRSSISSTQKVASSPTYRIHITLRRKTPRFFKVDQITATFLRHKSNG